MKKVVFFILVASLGNGCGYHLRGNSRELFEQHQIRTLYVESVKNNSYKAGTEIMVYNALRKRVAQGGYVRIVSDPDQADAILSATVSGVTSTPTGQTASSQLAPIGVGSPRVLVGTNYSVELQVGIALDLNKRGRRRLWSDTLSRSKVFAASTYMYPLGATSALINESELERSLQDLAVSIATDAEESMNAIF